MRNPQRIDLFLEKVNFNKYFKEICKFNISDEHIDMIELEKEYIRKVWKDNPDWRFSQVLVNTNLIPNYPGIWYYTEDDDILIALGHEPREIYFWGANFTKEGKKLPKTQWKLIKDLDTDHIEAILRNEFVSYGDKYFDIFNNELDLRYEQEGNN